MNRQYKSSIYYFKIYNSFTENKLRILLCVDILDIVKDIES